MLPPRGQGWHGRIGSELHCARSSSELVRFADVTLLGVDAVPWGAGAICDGAFAASDCKGCQAIHPRCASEAPYGVSSGLPFLGRGAAVVGFGETAHFLLLCIVVKINVVSDIYLLRSNLQTAVGDKRVVQIVVRDTDYCAASSLVKRFRKRCETVILVYNEKAVHFDSF